MPYINSRAAMAPGGVVQGLDELGAAIVGGLAKRKERDDAKKLRAEADQQRLRDLAISTGVDPTGKSPTELGAAIAGRVQTRHDEEKSRELQKRQDEGNYRAGQDREHQLDREFRAGESALEREARAARDQEEGAYREIEGMNRQQDRELAAGDRAEAAKNNRINALSRVVGDPDFADPVGVRGPKAIAGEELQRLILGEAPAAVGPRAGGPAQAKLDGLLQTRDPMPLEAAVGGQVPAPAAAAAPAPANAAPMGNIKAPVPLKDGSTFDPVTADRAEAGWRQEAARRKMPVGTYIRGQLANFPPELRALYEQHYGLAPVATAGVLDDIQMDTTDAAGAWGTGGTP
jgi:hypothetical protein